VGKNLRRASFRGAHAPLRVAFGALAKGIFAADRVGSAKKFASVRAALSASRTVNGDITPAGLP